MHEKEKWEPWKLKKLVATLFERLFHRFYYFMKCSLTLFRYASSSKGLPDDTEANREFGRVFLNVYSVKLLESFISQLDSSKGSWPRKLTSASLNFIGNRFLLYLFPTKT